MAVTYEEVEASFRPVRPSLGAARIRARARSRRRRVVRRRLSTGVVMVTIIVMVLMGGGSSIASRPGAPDSVVLKSGDTLWGLAERFAPVGIDKRAYVDAIYALNGISGAPQAGLRIELPGPGRG